MSDMIRRFLFLLILTVSCNENYYKDYAVVSATKEATEAGIKVLEQGGNAFDAMIAVDLALSVTYPNAGNLGGGGFMVYIDSSGQSGSLDFREKAPKKSHPSMYLDQNGEVITGLSYEGALSVGIPGTVAGLFEVYKKFGSISLDKIFEPAISLAKNGYSLTKKQAKLYNDSKGKILELNNTNLFSKDFKEGDVFTNDSLHNTLNKILKHGSDIFYKGEISNKIVNYVQSKGGIISNDDMASYSPIWRDAFIFNFNGYEIYTMGLPSSGGIVMAQILKSLELMDQEKIINNKIKYIKTLIELEKLSFADRSYFLGDPDFINTYFIDSIISNNYLMDRMKLIDFESSNPSKEIKHGEVKIIESEETTHYSIFDKYGNSVAVTTTLNGNFGSKLIIPELGFFLNNEMDDFAIKSDHQNIYGMLGGKNNSIEPEKRMLSSMTPTIIKKDDKVFMILGSPGGPTIITSVLQTILNVIYFDMSIKKSVKSPRFHHLWLPDIVYFEDGSFNKKMFEYFDGINYKLSKSSQIGRVDAILIENNKIFTAADPRGDDYASGK
jgi:gamma-glutamyltranspeptidase/glutathione hydrolase